MAASYPTSVWAGHSAPATLAGPPTHETMHEDVSAEIVATQTELGTNPSGTHATVTARFAALTSTFTAFTPTWTNLTVGDGTQSAAYAYIGENLQIIQVSLTLGSTTAIGTNPQLTLPDSKVAIGSNVGTLSMYDANATQQYVGGCAIGGTQTEVGLFSASGYLTATLPFTWATGDGLSLMIIVRVA